MTNRLVALFLAVVLLAGPASAVVPFGFLRNVVIVVGGGDPNLVGWWKLNDASGSSAADSSGNGITGTLVNAPTWITGPNSNGALRFALASDQHINLGAPAALNLTGAFTISAWVLQDADNTAYTIVARDDPAGRCYNLYASYGALRFSVNGAAPISSSVLTPGTWYHIVATYNPAFLGGATNLWVNGAFVTYNNAAGTTLNTGSTDVMIARRTYAGYTDPLVGSLDDVRIYNKTLSDVEIAALYAAGAK